MSSDQFTENLSPIDPGPELEVHPVQEFFESCGIDTSDFPKLRFYIEIRDRLSNNSHLFIPLRIPEKPGLVYETFARVTRMMEFPAGQGEGHRRIIEVEWRVDEQPTLETESHSALQFVSAEVECPTCRFFFAPEPTIMDESAVKITCPSCLNYWTVKVEAPKTPADSVQLINDAFYRDPSKFRRQLDLWASSEKERLSQAYRRHLPFEFSAWDDGSSIQWLYGEASGFSQIDGAAKGSFEILFKTFVNHLAFRYFNNPSGSRAFSRLDTTDILRKTDIQEKQMNRQELVSQFLPRGAEEEHAPSPQVADKQEFQFKPTYDPYAHGPARISSRSRFSGIVPIVLSLILFGGILSFFGYQYFAHQDQSELQVAKFENTTEEFSVEEPKSLVAAIDTQAIDRALEESRDTQVPGKLDEAEDSVSTIASQPIDGAGELSDEAEKADQQQDEADTQKAQGFQETQSSQKTPEAKPVKQLVAAKQSPPQNDAKIKERRQELQRKAIVDAGYRQGLLHLNLQQAKEAATEFERVIEIDPSHMESYRNLGLAYVYDRRFEAAIDAFEKYLGMADAESKANPKSVASVEQLLVTLKERVGTSARVH
jgi:hypothetical protein